MGTLETLGRAELIHGQHTDAVQPQKEEIHEVFMGKPVRREVGVQQAQAAQTACPGAGAGKFGDEDG